MNLRRLKYFVKIVDIGSLTQAAEVLYTARQATLSASAAQRSSIAATVGLRRIGSAISRGCARHRPRCRTKRAAAAGGLDTD